MLSGFPPLWKYNSKCTHHYPCPSSQIMAPCVLGDAAWGRALLLLDCPNRTEETHQMEGLGEDTQADLESRKIQTQEIPLLQKICQVWKNTSHFCTLNRLCVHPGLCSAATALLSARRVQETGKAGKDLETEKFLREKKLFLQRPLSSSSPSHMQEEKPHCLYFRKNTGLTGASPGSGYTALGSTAGTAAAPLVGAGLCQLPSVAPRLSQFSKVLLVSAALPPLPSTLWDI